MQEYLALKWQKCGKVLSWHLTQCPFLYERKTKSEIPNQWKPNLSSHLLAVLARCEQSLPEQHYLKDDSPSLASPSCSSTPLGANAASVDTTVTGQSRQTVVEEVVSGRVWAMLERLGSCNEAIVFKTLPSWLCMHQSWLHKCLKLLFLGTDQMSWSSSHGMRWITSQWQYICELARKSCRLNKSNNRCQQSAQCGGRMSVLRLPPHLTWLCCLLMFSVASIHYLWCSIRP